MSEPTNNGASGYWLLVLGLIVFGVIMSSFEGREIHGGRILVTLAIAAAVFFWASTRK